MFAVCVRPSARKKICSPGLVWVRDEYHELYVTIKERGTWRSKEEAERVVTEIWEIVVDIGD